MKVISKFNKIEAAMKALSAERIARIIASDVEVKASQIRAMKKVTAAQYKKVQAETQELLENIVTSADEETVASLKQKLQDLLNQFNVIVGNIASLTQQSVNAEDDIKEEIAEPEFDKEVAPEVIDAVEDDEDAEQVVEAEEDEICPECGKPVSECGGPRAEAEDEEVKDETRTAEDEVEEKPAEDEIVEDEDDKEIIEALKAADELSEELPEEEPAMEATASEEVATDTTIEELKEKADVPGVDVQAEEVQGTPSEEVNPAGEAASTEEVLVTAEEVQGTPSEEVNPAGEEASTEAVLVEASEEVETDTTIKELKDKADGAGVDVQAEDEDEIVDEEEADELAVEAEEEDLVPSNETESDDYIEPDNTLEEAIASLLNGEDEVEEDEEEKEVVASKKARAAVRQASASESKENDLVSAVRSLFNL